MVLAPTLFDIVSSRHEATEVLTVALQKIDLFGIFAGPLLFVTLIAGWLPLQTPLRLRALITFGMTLAVGVSGQWVTPRIEAIQAAMGRPLQDMDPTSIAMVEFDQLHAVSSGLMVFHVAAALVLLVLAVRASKPKRSFGIEL